MRTRLKITGGGGGAGREGEAQARQSANYKQHPCELGWTLKQRYKSRNHSDKQ